MAKLIAIVALFACVALALAAEPAKKEAASSDLQTANSFYGGLGYGAYGGYGYPGFYGGYGGYGYPGYFGYRGFYGGYPAGYGGYGFYG